MRTLRDKIYNAINRERSTNGSVKFEGYEDDYDGFTHMTYSGLVYDIEDALFEDGLTNPTQKEIDEYVFQMI